MIAWHGYTSGRSRVRGVISLMAVLFLLTVIAAVLATTLAMTSSDVLDSSAQSRSVEALLLAESGVERAVSRFANAVACGSLGESVNHGSGSITVAVALSQVDFSGAPLPASQCRVSVTGQAPSVGGNAARTIDVVIAQGGGVITFVAGTFNNGGGGNVSALTVNVPAGVVANDVMVAQINVRGGTSRTITAPAGWALVPNGRINSTTVLAQAVYYRVAGASEPVSYTWSWAPTSDRASAGIAAFRGVHTTTPVDVANGQATGSSTNILAPSITTTVANTMLVGLFGHARADTISPPVDMVEAFQTATGGGPNGSTSEAAYVAQAATGATGSRTATSTQSAISIGHLVALRPAAGGAGSSVLAWREVIQ